MAWTEALSVGWKLFEKSEENGDERTKDGKDKKGVGRTAE